MTDKDEQGHSSTVGIVASALFQSATGQTPEHFANGMWEKAKSISVDPIMRVYGPDGMLNRAADKAVDRAMGVDKPDSAYASKEQMSAFLDAIVTIGVNLFPGLGTGIKPAAPGEALATAEGTVVRAADGAAAVERPPFLMAKQAGDGNPPEKPDGKTEKAAGPGKWTPDMEGGENMNADAAKYQKQVTGHRPDETYHVNGRSFDGYEPGKKGQPDTLIEAKHYADDGRFVKAFDNMMNGNFKDYPHLIERASSILDQARGQVKAAEGTGAKIEWRVSSEKGATAVRMLFDHDPALRGRITVEHVPMKAEKGAVVPGESKAATAPKTERPVAPKPEPSPAKTQRSPDVAPKPNSEQPPRKPEGDEHIPKTRG